MSRSTAKAEQHVVPLATLNPDTDSNSFIRAVVILLWPYSPSSLRFRLSVSEEDFRLRHNRGQLRLDFRGACAKELSTRDVQIGDQILLSLKGGEYRPLKSATTRDVPWILKFERKAHFQLRNESDWILIDEPESPAADSPIPLASKRPTPVPSISDTVKNIQQEWSTPTAFKRRRPLEGSEDTYFGNLFNEEELELENPPKRLRFTASSYRMVSRSPSPVTEGAKETMDEGGMHEEIASEAVMRPTTQGIYDGEPVPVIGAQGESDDSREIKGNIDKKRTSLLESVGRKLTAFSNRLLKSTQAGQEPKARPEHPQPRSSRSLSVKFEPGITTDISDFPPLSKLRFGIKADIIGVVARSKPVKRATRGPKDYFTSIRVIDRSKPTGLTITVFRPREEAVIKADVGDCVLLRDFKILTQKNQLVGLSADTSAWAVWKWSKENIGLERPAIICGPPVEFGPQEEQYAELVGQWYWRLDETMRKNLSLWDEEGSKQKETAEGSMEGTIGP